MLGEPRAAQLLEAVAGYLEQLVPSLEGRNAFHGRVAINVLRLVAREFDHGADLETDELNRLHELGFQGQIDEARRALCHAIRQGDYSATSGAITDHLLCSAVERVAIEQPSYASLMVGRGAPKTAP